MEVSARTLNPTITSLSALNNRARSHYLKLAPNSFVTHRPIPPRPKTPLSRSSSSNRPYYCSASHRLNSPNSGFLGFLPSLSTSPTQSHHIDPPCCSITHNSFNFFQRHPAPPKGIGVLDRRGGGVGLLGSPPGGPSVTVVLLGWLGARSKHLKRYVDLYTSRGIDAVAFVVPVKDVLWFDLGRSVQQRISALSTHLASWLSEEPERSLLFHTFSNTGWLVYGAVLDHLQGRQDLLEKIKGCVFDSGADAELNPKVWAAGFSAALLKKRNVATYPASEIGEAIEQEYDLTKSSTQEEPPLIDTLLLSILEKLFSYVLNLHDVNRRLVKIISLLSTNQPRCPQLYLYSRADKVIPFQSVEMFIEGQRRIGRKVQTFNFGSSAHVDHYRSFPHVYTSELHNFLQDCLTTAKQL